MKRREPAARPLLEFLAASAAALALAFVAFAPALRAEFVSDDINAIVENEWVQGPVDPAGIFASASWWGKGRADASGYRPLTTLSFAASRRLAGAQPYGFRVLNYVLHALCAGLVFALARALGLGLVAGALAGALFAVLPIHSEAVIWIVGRAELGAAAAFLVACLACLAHRRSGSIAALVAAAVSIAAGMAFKENAVTALAVPAIFFWTLPRQPVSMRRDLAAFGALLAGAVVYALLRASVEGPLVASEPASLLDNPLSVADPATRWLGAIAVAGRYIALTLWPASLSVDYSFDSLGIGPGFVANADSVIAVAFTGAAVWALLRGPGRREIVAAGLLLALASYSIVSNTVFVMGTILGERLFYLPSAGIALALAALAEPLLSRARSSQAWRAATGAVVLVIFGAAVAVDLQRSLDWRTPVTLFEAAARAVPRSARVHMELASAYGNAKRIEEAEKEFDLALAILPDYAAAWYNRGNMLARSARYEDAAAAFRRSVAANPALTRAWHNLALTERIRGRGDAWVDALRGAVESSPGAVPLRAELADALLSVQRYSDAIPVYDSILAQGAAPATLFNRGVARHHLGGCANAVDDYRQAAALPNAPREAFTAAAGCLRELGRSEEAEQIERASKVANR